MNIIKKAGIDWTSKNKAEFGACLLCHRFEPNNFQKGKLIPFPRNDKLCWVHENCLNLETFDLSQNEINKRIQSAEKQLCFNCCQIGATYACALYLCGRMFHYPCLFEQGSRAFQLSSKIYYCSSHVDVIQEYMNNHVSCRVCSCAGNLKDLLYCSECDTFLHGQCQEPPVDNTTVFGPFSCFCCKKCAICCLGSDPELLFVCSVCDRGYHTYCLSPGEGKTPFDSWVCASPACLSKQKNTPSETYKRQLFVDNALVFCSTIPSWKNHSRDIVSTETVNRLLEGAARILFFQEDLTAVEFCYICGISEGNDADYIHCIQCGECFHIACVGRPHTDVLLCGWRCYSCQACEICFNTLNVRKGVMSIYAQNNFKISDENVPKPVDNAISEQHKPPQGEGSPAISCRTCQRVFHIACLRSCAGATDLSTWNCLRCRGSCVDCGQREPNSYYKGDGVCRECAHYRRMGHVCCVCDSVYDEIRTLGMVKCEECCKWVHFVCLNIDREQQSLISSEFPFYCPDCTCLDDCKTRSNRLLKKYLEKKLEAPSSKANATCTLETPLAHETIIPTPLPSAPLFLSSVSAGPKAANEMLYTSVYSNITRHLRSSFLNKVSYFTKDRNQLQNYKTGIQRIGKENFALFENANNFTERLYPRETIAVNGVNEADDTSLDFRYFFWNAKNRHSRKWQRLSLLHRRLSQVYLTEANSGEQADFVSMVADSQYAFNLHTGWINPLTLQRINRLHLINEGDIIPIIRKGKNIENKTVKPLTWYPLPRIAVGERDPRKCFFCAVDLPNETLVNYKAVWWHSSCIASCVDYKAHLESLLKLLFLQDMYNVIYNKTTLEEELGFHMKSRVGALTIHSIGNLVPTKEFVSEDRACIYPVGYRATRLYWSLWKPTLKAVYTCLIKIKNNRPLFKLSCPSENWKLRNVDLNALYASFIEKVNQARFAQHKDGIWKGQQSVYFENKAPLTFFGLNHDLVTWRIENLPGAWTLEKFYDFKHFTHPKTLKSRYEALNLPSYHLNHPPRNGLLCARLIPYCDVVRMKDCWCSVEKIPLKSKLPMKSVKALETISYFTDLSKAKASRSSKPQPRSLENQYLTLEASSRLRTVVSKSSIQGRGVFATQPFEKGEVVMEYTGELVRPIIADARESFYKQYGLGDYVFRLTDSVYIDATFKGNNARFINHSCEPNCKSLVVNIEGEAKIIIISARDIEAGEELSYDYKFDWEDEKKKEECRCGALNCKKYLNYIDRVKKRG
ncbi:uncharacterized protein LOC135120398 isoform X2 [Zophobas morio]|uniref:uncharacterized protein LOC135120398 isoform X2 n=1 Tax=Zophobas morio TaxID=2755281 RepID=UPI0030839AB5